MSLGPVRLSSSAARLTFAGAVALLLSVACSNDETAQTPVPTDGGTTETPGDGTVSLDTPESRDSADASSTGEATDPPDAPTASDTPETGSDLAEVSPECTTEADCVGKLAGLLPCERATCAKKGKCQVSSAVTNDPCTGVPGGVCLCTLGACNCVEGDCADKVDNDANGATDCGDPVCDGTASCAVACPAAHATLECGKSVEVPVAGPKAATDLVLWTCGGQSAGAWPGPETMLQLPPLKAGESQTVSLVSPPAGVQLMHMPSAKGSCQKTACGQAGATAVAITSASKLGDYVVLETDGKAKGVVTLALDCQACKPQCTGKSCGADGCGGSCGACGSGELCDSSGLCQATPTNATCATSESINAIPFVTSSSNVGAGDDFALPAGTSCGTPTPIALGSGSNDTVYQFTPTVDATFLIALNADFAASLAITESCAAYLTTCISADKTSDTGGTIKLLIPLKGGFAYTIIVDGVSGSATGSYTLTVAPSTCAATCSGKTCGPDGCGGFCGTCASGAKCNAKGQCAVGQDNDTCKSPVLITAVPSVLPPQSTVPATDDFALVPGQCKGGPAVDTGNGAADLVYQFVAPASGKYRVTATPTGGFDPALYVVDACPSFGFKGCHAIGSTQPAGSAEVVELVLTSGDVRWFIVDGASDTDTGEFSLAVEALECTPACEGKGCGANGCGGSCGTCGEGTTCAQNDTCVTAPPNDTCATATPIFALPFTVESTTLGAKDDYLPPLGIQCDGAPTGTQYGKGVDVVYTYTAPKNQTLQIKMDNSDPLACDYDTYVYVVTACNDLGGSCLGMNLGAQKCNNNLTVPVLGGQTIFIVVDHGPIPLPLAGNFKLHVLVP